MSRALLVFVLLLGSSARGMPWLPAAGEWLGAALPISLGWDPNGSPGAVEPGGNTPESGAGSETDVSPGWDPNG